ncbi:unnamed protein product [Alopecurus aequalis]
MSAGGNMAQARSLYSPAAEWSGLPDDLLGMILYKIASPRDRICFAAVCSTWRGAASLHPPPPALPLLLLSPRDEDMKKRLYCPEGGCILSVPLSSRLCGMWLNGSYEGGWIVAGSKIPRLPVVIMNLFSGVEVVLSEKQRSIDCPRHPGPHVIWKIIFSEAPTSSGCILAAMTNTCNIALCRIGCPDGGWTMEGCEREELADIVFCQGELYGLTRYSENLFKYDIGENKDGAPVVTAARQLNIKRRDGPMCTSDCSFDYASYIFELCGKLAMAVMIPWSQNRKEFFKVFELVQTNAKEDTHDYKWVELHSLGDYALFLGQAFSCRVVHVPLGGRGGVERNHIYYSHFRALPANSEKEFDGKGYLTRSVCGDRMYCREDQNVGDSGDDVQQITALGYYILGGPYVPMWFFPPDF